MRILLAGFGAVLAASTTSAYAQSICAPRQISVPSLGVAGTPEPDWSTDLCAVPTPPAECSTNDDDPHFRDPRWTGSATASFGPGTVGASPNAWLRTMHRTVGSDTTVYMWINVDVNVDPEAQKLAYIVFEGPDRIAVRVSIEDPADQRAVAVPRCEGSPAVCETTDPIHYRLYRFKADEDIGGGDVHPVFQVQSTANLATPPWLENMRIFKLQQRWALLLEIPVRSAGTIADGIDPSATAWVEITETNGASLTALDFDFPDGGDIFEGPNPDEIALLDVPTTSIFTFPQNSPPAECTDQIRVDRGDIGIVPAVTTLDAIRTEDFSDNNELFESGDPNIFVVRPVNAGTDPLDVGALEARFRIAGWGMQDLFVDSPELWRDIPPGSGFVALTETVPSGQKGVIHSATHAFTETICDASDRSTCAAGELWKHQCVMVQLEPGAGGITIRRDSHYRNTNFDTSSSVFERSAEIMSAKLPGGEGDIYLYVRRRNMPASYPAPTTSIADVQLRLAAEVKRLTEYWRSQREMPPEVRAFVRKASAFNEAVEANQLSGDDALAAIRSSFTDETIVSLMPTFEISAFRETGKKRKIDDKEYTVLAPMTSMGYVMNHDGALHGWSSALSGPLEKLAPDFYRIKAKNKEASLITTRIKAHESENDPVLTDTLPGGKKDAGPTPGPDGGKRPTGKNGGCCKCEVTTLGEASGLGGLIALAAMLASVVCRRRRRREGSG